MHSEQGRPQLTSVLPCRHESDTTDLYCIFDPDTAHRLAGRGREWREHHRLGQADFKVRSNGSTSITPLRLMGRSMVEYRMGAHIWGFADMFRFNEPKESQVLKRQLFP